MLIEIGVAVLAFFIVLGFIGFYVEYVFDWYAGVLEALYGLWGEVRIAVGVVTTLVNIGIVGFIVVILRRYLPLRASPPIFVVPSSGGREESAVPLEKEVEDEWQEIRKLMDSDNTSEWNMAVLRADALLDETLQQAGYEGMSAKERLDRVDPTHVPSLDRLVSAHRLRNMIAHDPTILHTRETIIQVLRSYEQGFKELGVLKEE